MYRNKYFNINILGPNKKNIAGVNEFVDNHDTPKHLIIGIGNTDISSRPLSECMADMTVCLLSIVAEMNTIFLVERFMFTVNRHRICDKVQIRVMFTEFLDNNVHLRNIFEF
jgi:hypothetical protein